MAKASVTSPSAGTATAVTNVNGGNHKAQSLTISDTATYNLDLSKYDWFDYSINGACTLTITNPASGFNEFFMRIQATSTFSFSGNVIPTGNGVAFDTTESEFWLHLVSVDGTNWFYTIESSKTRRHASTHRAGGSDPLLSNTTSLGTSNNVAPSQNAVKTYVDSAVAGIGGVIVPVTGQLVSDVVKTTTGGQDLITLVVPAAAGDVIELMITMQIVSGGSVNGANLNFNVAGGSDLSLAPKTTTIVGTPQNASSVAYYTVQAGDIVAGNVTIKARASLDNTNGTTFKGVVNVYNVFSAKNLKH